ncbi:MAG: aspartate-semialdehyde dehydrogenase [Pseudodesulfovibrio sp.]|jgi:aspartate-semialdehyde dehydrogenase|uniref:Aspartate-semialdehyde dehydrogenase n=1 Tax=Pseudodesulfovibrio indicus TaxID=1716143 RepID=A0A126QNS5_9BACT|nr:aspartate-semialdehyde dehydrogenase [Pseudodesulfovibrio indicus]AMK11571.1 aspartate-semialdehyde dehydrogenase [Pseudodesulfovibrio indicus]TDT89977.1 aspartate semialdehyde dehydrogenase [Pseudodesulfovibrio indicus]
MSKNFVVAVCGATGAVGQEMLKVLEQRNFPCSEIIPLASARSAGKKVSCQGQELTVRELTKDSFKGVDIALFSAGGAISKEFAPIAAASGCVVVDNSAAWRMDDECPLVVPEVNPHDLDWHKGIIANPNCSTIQMMVALKPIHDEARIKRVVVSTYQAVSGTGQKAIEELENQVRRLMSGQPVVADVYAHQIAFNCLPHIDVFQPNGYTKEEMKMVNETTKIMGDPTIKVTATCVRVPVFYGHSESVNIETEQKLSADDVRSLLAKAPGIIIEDYPEKLAYPMPINAAGEDATYVGRIREDETIDNGINMWIVSDNIRKGAALNTVQIAEVLIERDLVRVP